MGGSNTLGSVGRHSTETTEINRGGEWAGGPPTGPVPQEEGPLPAHLARPPKPCSPGSPRLRCCGTDTKHPADRLSGKGYNVGPPSVLVLVFLLVFLDLVVLRGCKSFLGGIEDANDARDDRAVLTFVFLADELDVSEFAEVEVALLL